MDATTFAVTYEVAAPTRATALDRAGDRLRRALAVGVEYVVRGERCRQGGEAYAVTLLVELTRVAPRLRTNLAFHALLPDATVRAV
jgi:hypothetical protein